MIGLKITIIPFLLLLILKTGAQTTNKITYSSVHQMGLLTGDNGEALSLQTINGVKKDKWFAGVGVGLDFYKDRTIPLFLDIRRDFTRKKNTPFVFADAGLNFRWLTKYQKNEKAFYLDYTTPAGFYYDVGVGWKLAGKNNRAFIFNAGYSFKQVKETIKLRWGAPTPQLLEQNNERYNYLYRRLVIKMGIVL